MGNFESGMNNIMDSDAISSYSSEDDVEIGFEMFHMLMDNNENGESRSNEDYFFNLLLQRFIHTDDYNFDRPAVNPRHMRMPVIKAKISLESIKKNPIYQSIKYASGFGSDQAGPELKKSASDDSGSGQMGSEFKKYSIIKMINNRQNGIGYKNGAFTQSERCKLGNTFLPNSKKALIKFGAKAFCGTFSPNGKYFTTASQDSIIRVHDATTSEYTQVNQMTAKDVNWCILDIAYSPNSEYIVYSTWSSCLYINSIYGNTQQLQPLFLQPLKQNFCIFSLAFSNSGEQIIGGASDGCLYVYDRVNDRRSLRVPIDNDSHDINTVGFIDETSNIIYTGTDNGIVKMWDRRCLDESNPKEIGLFLGHLDGITHVDSKGDARYLISNSKDQTIKLWDMRVFSSNDLESTTNQRRRFRYQNRWDYRWDDVPREFYGDKNRMTDDVSIMTYRGHRVCKTLIRAKFSPQETTGQRFIYTGCGSGRLIIFDILTGYIKYQCRGHKDIVRDVAWHPSRNEILTTSWDNNVNLNFYQYQDKNFSKRLLKDEIRKGSNKSDPPPRRSRRIALRQSNQHAVL